jgi:hypothetical protein
MDARDDRAIEMNGVLFDSQQKSALVMASPE